MTDKRTGCRKRPFDSAERAQSVAREKGHPDTHVYRCPLCRFFHYTSTAWVFTGGRNERMPG